MAATFPSTLQLRLLRLPTPRTTPTRFGNPRRLPHKRRQFALFSSSKPQSPPPETATPETAESCVNLGLSLFAKGRVKDAMLQFESALALNPNPIEAQAAWYNKACCHARRGEGKQAAECLRNALRDYNLKFSTILDDPDLASFRAMPEFKELQDEARLGGEDIGYGFRRDLKLISEVQAPFRGVRRFFYVAFTAAAGISTFFTIPRLFRAIIGGDGAPDILETVQNAAINIGVACRHYCSCGIIHLGQQERRGATCTDISR